MLGVLSGTGADNKVSMSDEGEVCGWVCARVHTLWLVAGQAIILVSHYIDTGTTSAVFKVA